MNPYFEETTLWLDFHTEYLSAVRRLLVPQVAPNYIVQLEEHIYIHDTLSEPRQRLGTADQFVVRTRGDERASAALGLLEAPAEVWLPEQDVEKIPYLEVRDRVGRELVTVIELLSPSNKRAGDDREQYLAKRRELLRSPTHLVEIDLLRGWAPMPQERRPDCDYSVMVSRAEKRRAADFWPIRLRERLPVIPIPLRSPDAAAPVDFQEALNRAYDGPGYEHFIYRGEPEPSLSSDDAAWARTILPQLGQIASHEEAT
jgi:hypothetical protein